MQHDLQIPEAPQIEVSEASSTYMMLYGINVNLQRAIPFIQDGLKPIGRKILFSVYDNYKDRKFSVKAAKGAVGLIHAHGDQSVEDIFAKMAQPFVNNQPMMTSKGHAGNAVSGKDFAAARYNEMHMSKFAYEILFDEFDGEVNMIPNYDDSRMEPYILPAKFPLILLNGDMGIGYTLSSTMQPYNLNDIADATIKLIDNPDARIRLIPDSPTGCNILIVNDQKFILESAYELDNVNYIIKFKNTPYGEFVDDIDARLRKLQDSPNKIPEVLSADILSHNINKTQKAWTYEIRCAPCNLQQIVRQLFKKVDGFQSTISTTNMQCVDKFQIKHYDPRQILCRWIQHRILDKHNFYIRKLVKTTAKLNKLEGKAFLLSHKNCDTTVKIIRGCETPAAAIPALMDHYKGQVSSSQVHFVCELQIGRMTIKEYEKTLEAIKETEEKIAYYRDIVEHPKKVKQIIIDELKEIKSKYGSPRKSKILNNTSGENFNIEVVQILKDGSILLGETENPELLSSDVTPLSGDRFCVLDEFGNFIWVDIKDVQHNQPMTLTSIGKGSPMGKCVFVSSNGHNDVLILTNKARLKFMPIERIPSNATKRPVVPMEEDEYIVTALELSNANADVLIYTKDGLGKRIQTSDLHKQMSIDAAGNFIIKDCDNAGGMFTINPDKPLLVYVTQSGRMRVNKAQFLNAGKKYGSTNHIIKLGARDDLVAVFCSKPGKTVTLNHADGQISTVNIDSLGIVTMATDPKRPKHVPGKAPVIRATLS